MKKLINWFEIPAINFERAVKFYESLFNYKLNICDFGEEKMAFFPSEDMNIEGAISQAKGFLPSENGVNITFYWENDINELIDKVEKLGGKVAQPKTKIEAEGRGYFATIIDTEGNKIGLYSDI